MKRAFQSKVQGGMNCSRRRFVQGFAAAGSVLGSGILIDPALGAGAPVGAGAGVGSGTATGSAPVLSGTEFDLVIAQTPVNFTGRPRLATTINGSLPGPVLRWREGDTVTLRVTNRLPVSSSIHWHGIIVPANMDGVPGISYDGIPPGETFVYRFKVQQSGTYWYHSHTAFQEQTGLYGALIIDPAEGRNRIEADRDYVVQMSDWTDEDPLDVFAKLKKQSDYYNFNQVTAGDFFQDVSTMGLKGALDKRRMWNRMRMNPTDLADLSGYTYTYLMNGMAPADNWTALFNPGERVRLRFINAGTQTFYDVRIPGLKLTVVHVDGQDVEPVTVDEFRVGPAETYDVIVSPESDQAYTIFAQSMGRTGYARGTLAPRAGMSAPVPAMDEPEWLTMADMMGSMAGANMSGMAMAGMAHGNMPGNTNKSAGNMAGNMGNMGNMKSPVRAHHARTEYGPGVDMRVDTPRTNLDDPGIGLRDNGRTVLTYADLHTIGGPLDPRDAGREIELHLTGNMERYIWSLDGLTFGSSTPVHFRRDERLRVILVNDTMMTHPMHLHGMWSELENPDGGFQTRRHTISVQPAQRISFLVNADAPGGWAWHCHLLYHMHAGMFREVVVS